MENIHHRETVTGKVTKEIQQGIVTGSLANGIRLLWVVNVPLQRITEVSLYVK